MEELATAMLSVEGAVLIKVGVFVVEFNLTSDLK